MHPERVLNASRARLERVQSASRNLRFYMKGLCNRKGFPKEIPWLSTFEPQIIITRFNMILRGLANTYGEFIDWPSKLSRWIYILRYSCLKTLAQKYKTNIKGIFKRFGKNMHSRASQTISVKHRIIDKRKKEYYEKEVTLLTYTEVLKQTSKLNQKEKYLKIYLDRREGKIGEYPLKDGRMPRITNEDFLEAITWVSWRTLAQIDLPCCRCGSMVDVEMHHIKHVRKQAYTMIKEPKTWEKIMSLRNRKQIPICRACHEDAHSGRYDGENLKLKMPQIIYKFDNRKLVDNRIAHIESFILKVKVPFSLL